MAQQNHWGITVDTDKPLTGVYNANEYAQFISDEDSIDLDYESWQADHECEDPENCECEYYSDGSSTLSDCTTTEELEERLTNLDPECCNR